MVWDRQSMDAAYKRSECKRMAAESALDHAHRPATSNQVESLRILADAIGVRLIHADHLTANQASHELAILTTMLHQLRSRWLERFPQ